MPKSLLAHILHHKRLIPLASPLCHALRVTLRVVQSDGHLAAMHFCFLPVQDSPVSPSPVLPPPRRFVSSYFSQKKPRYSFSLSGCISRWLAILSASRFSASPLSWPLLFQQQRAWSIGAGVLHPFVLHASYHRLPAQRERERERERDRENAGNLPRSFSPLFHSFVSPPLSTEHENWPPRNFTSTTYLLTYLLTCVHVLGVSRGSFYGDCYLGGWTNEREREEGNGFYSVREANCSSGPIYTKGARRMLG